MSKLRGTQMEDTELDMGSPPSGRRSRGSLVRPLLIVVLAVIFVWMDYVLLARNRRLRRDLEEVQSGLHQVRTTIERREARAKERAEPEIPEFVYDFESAEQLEDWTARSGGWEIAEGRLAAEPDGARARVLLGKVFRGYFLATFTVEREEGNAVPSWGCALFDDGFGRSIVLELDAQNRVARLSLTSNRERGVLCRRPLDAAFFERRKVELSVEYKDSFITVRDADRVVLVGWDDGRWAGRFGLLCSGPVTFDDVRIRSQPDGRAELVNKSIGALAEQHRWDFQLDDWKPVPPESWEGAEGAGKGISAEGGIVCLAAPGDVWRLFGEGEWDRYLADLEIRTRNWGTIFVGADKSGSGYLLELPTNPIDTFHMHRMREGRNEEEIPAAAQAIRLVPGDWHRVRLFVSPTRVIVYLDDVRVYDFAPADFPRGKFGIYGWSGVSADYRNIRVAPPKMGAAKDAPEDERGEK